MTRSAKRRAAFDAEALDAKAAWRRGDLDAAFRLLERAHILGQPWAGAHSWTHWTMLRIAWRRRDAWEIRGQLLRLAAGGLLSWMGRRPVGNTGGADVPPTMPTPLPQDLAEYCR